MAIKKSGISGIPFGNTANRPASPVIGQTYYNGQIEALEIYNGTTWKVAKSEGFPPDAPTISSVTDSSTSLAYSSTAGTLNVVFVPAGTGGTATQYNAYTTVGGHSGFTTVGNTVTITGLTPGTAYSVYGNAQNGSGTSTNTATASPVTPTTLPEAPTIGTATSADALISLTFTAGATGGSAITNYQWSTNNSTYTALSPADTTSPVTIPGLTNGTSYTVRLKAVNANGAGVASSASNSATPLAPAVNYLVVAGGGSGGGLYRGGGGGAGGMRCTVTNTGGGGTLETPLAISLSTNYQVIVGGGAAAGVAGANGNPGTNSVFGSITSTGGGYGGGNWNTAQAGGPGGSGGGSPSASPTAGAGGTRTASPVQGFNGGVGFSGDTQCGGGGGGAGAVGKNGGSGATDGDGGDGLASLITGTSVTYAGGGGGGNYGTGNVTIGGAGGGGAGGSGGSPYVSGNPGTINTGGGGGGASGDNLPGGAGGKGIVILRYPTTMGTITIGAGLTGTTETDGSDKVTTITNGSGNVSWA